MLKTARFGYDGKGQARIDAATDAAAAWDAIGGRAVLEAFVDFEPEFSILIARGQRRRDACATTRRVNVHRDAILRTSTAPRAGRAGRQIEEADRARAAGSPRRSTMSACWRANSSPPPTARCSTRWRRASTIRGHWTIEGAATSQFENHIRAICGLPLGSDRADRARASRCTI